MPRSKSEVAREKLRRLKDQKRKIDSQADDVKLEAGRVMLAALEAGVSKSQLCADWATSNSEVRRMIARDSSERR